MILKDIIKALEVKGIVVALDVGVHEYCELNSNCPLAIQLRRLIADAGITLEQLLEGYQEVIAPDSVEYESPEFNATVHLRLAGRTVDLDIGDIVSRQARAAIEEKLAEIEGMKMSIKNWGVGFQQLRLSEIKKQRDSQTLPQLSFSPKELLKCNCLITSHGRDYIFLFPSEYSPQYLIRRGIRYKLADSDIVSIKREAYLQFTINQGGKFLQTDLLDEEGNKLYHYHGTDADCWGNVTLPGKWEGDLGSLNRLAHNLMMSLATINYDSLLVGHPHNMPRAEELLERSTKLGREGELEVVREEQPTEARGWGTNARWRVGRGQARRQTEARTPGHEGELTFGEEVVRRFNTIDPGLDAVCALCGETFGEHFGMDEAVCPADWRARVQDD